MNWDAVSAIAEVIGGIVVVFSLLYFAAQFRQANNHAQASSQAIFMEGWNNAIKSWVQDSATVSVIRSGFKDFDRLSNDDQAVFHMQIAAVHNQWVLAAALYEKDMIPESLYQGATDVMVSIYSTTGGRMFLEKNMLLTPRGEELVRLVESNSNEVKPIVEVFPWWNTTNA
jgi:hypothetical protein